MQIFCASFYKWGPRPWQSFRFSVFHKPVLYYTTAFAMRLFPFNNLASPFFNTYKKGLENFFDPFEKLFLLNLVKFDGILTLLWLMDFLNVRYRWNVCLINCFFLLWRRHSEVFRKCRQEDLNADSCSSTESFSLTNWSSIFTHILHLWLKPTRITRKFRQFRGFS